MGVLVVAANLRAVISAVGPVLPVIGDDTGMSSSELGFLAAAPVVSFALVSPVVHAAAQRFGTDRTLLGSAAVASGLAVPLAAFTGSWRLAIGVWGCLVLGAWVWWLPSIPSPPRRPTPPLQAVPAVAVSLWRTSLAWQVAGYFGLQSTAFYVLLSWLPSVEQDVGISPTVAGVHCRCSCHRDRQQSRGAPAAHRRRGPADRRSPRAGMNRRRHARVPGGAVSRRRLGGPERDDARRLDGHRPVTHQSASSRGRDDQPTVVDGAGDGATPASRSGFSWPEPSATSSVPGGTCSDTFSYWRSSRCGWGPGSDGRCSSRDPRLRGSC